MAITPETLDIIDRSNLSDCNPPPIDVANRTIAVVSSQPRNTSLFPTLPELKLYHGSIYIFPRDESIQPETVGICFYLPSHYQNRSSIENGVDPMSEWATLSVLEWQYKLTEKEAIFRRCAYSENAPLDCPVMSSLTSHHTLWRSNTIIGIMGFGHVGKVMADHFVRLGVKHVIATARTGPFEPLPDGLSWYGS